MKNNTLEQSVLKELYELDNWPHVIIEIGNNNIPPILLDNSGRKSSYLKIDTSGNYKEKIIYYGTNNRGLIIKDGSLFIRMAFVGYSAIDHFPIFELGNYIQVFRAEIKNNLPINFADVPSGTIASIFNCENSLIVEPDITNGSLQPVCHKNITARAELVNTIEDHIRGYNERK